MLNQSQLQELDQIRSNYSKIHDELTDLNCFGLLLKYNIKKGITNKNNKNYNFIKYYTITSEYPNIFVKFYHQQLTHD